ncbi:cytochrome-c oxidase [Paenibacillus mesophilus]|uniref:cytochrome-c oxidase n=1 Tax=Paenibacillus mesophilus TaxID=2582849 RepID=UPI00110E9576|nr:cytochrome-c oxidase [Paenibacillus mesophilus]TMV49124.1 cytochrome-c oxidase [Paenibacillus mesophilus]
MGTLMLKIASFYFLVGVVMGMGMSMTESFGLSPVHVHLNLIGWVSMAIGGLVYDRFPAASRTLGKLHFWMHNIGVPLMMGGLAAYILGFASLAPLIPVGGILIVLGTLIFFINIVRNVHASKEVHADRSATRHTAG